jgi:allantoate deiminase
MSHYSPLPGPTRPIVAASTASAQSLDRAGRLLDRCDRLATHSAEPGRITRPYGTPSLAAARDDLADWMRAAGMTISIDAIGTLRGRYEGTEPSAAALLLGSHFDSVRDAGRYDGNLGILVAIAAVEHLANSERRLPFPIETVAFPDEEGLRFQTTYLGSCALSGAFEPALLDYTDDAGLTLREAIVAFGGNPDALAAAALQPDDAFAYLEVHIEQGPYLESVDAPVGVVTAISGQSRITAAFVGKAGHAGTVDMNLRRDPLPAAAELILAAETLARETPGLLATVGKIEASPGAGNVIPGRVDFSLDVRHPEDATRDEAVDALRARAGEIAGLRSLEAEWRVMRDHHAVRCDDALVERLSRAVAEVGLPVVGLPSGAGHDAVAMSALLPAAMLFVRCTGGISHHPDEAVTASDVADAIEVIDRVLDSLAETGLD